MDYLHLCQDFVSELGLAGGSGPTHVTNQRGELLNVTRWIRDANLWVDNLWTDWRYHWTEYFGTIAINANTITPPTIPVGHWDRNSFWVDKESSVASQLTFMEWSEYRRLYDTGTALAQRGQPSIVTVRPDNSLRFYVASSVQRTVRAEYWRKPKVLAADTDVPLMPEQFHRIIIARAAIMYGNREDAPEVIAGMEAEYVDLLEKLQSDQAPGFYGERSSSQDITIGGEIPGAGH